ncbi:uncharacterized protein LOC121766876 [Salvia splendens]|uniref:uncharacterized protein LOC121766876 n=1 Tax=Salvia splendens TaxID=180675 RepID=UPI001C280EE9|nr:uncharacterized protein LOC121766876 [Salvia splendens]
MRNRYSSNRDHPVECYQDYEWDGKLFLMSYVTGFYDKWMNAYAPPDYTARGDLVGLIEVLLPAMTAAFDGPPRAPPPHIYPPIRARMRRNRCDMEPHVSRVPKRMRLGIRISAPLRIDREVDGMLGIVPPPVGVEEESEEEDPEEDLEEEEPEEEENPNRESIGETGETKEDEDEKD